MSAEYISFWHIHHLENMPTELEKMHKRKNSAHISNPRVKENLFWEVVFMGLCHLSSFWHGTGGPKLRTISEARNNGKKIWEKQITLLTRDKKMVTDLASVIPWFLPSSYIVPSAWPGRKNIFPSQTKIASCYEWQWRDTICGKSRNYPGPDKMFLHKELQRVLFTVAGILRGKDWTRYFKYFPGYKIILLTYFAFVSLKYDVLHCIERSERTLQYTVTCSYYLDQGEL